MMIRLIMFMAMLFYTVLDSLIMTIAYYYYSFKHRIIKGNNKDK